MYLYARLNVLVTPGFVSTTTSFNPTVMEGGKVHLMIVLSLLRIGLEHIDVPIKTLMAEPPKFAPYIDIVDAPATPPRRGKTEYTINCAEVGSTGLYTNKLLASYRTSIRFPFGACATASPLFPPISMAGIELGMTELPSGANIIRYNSSSYFDTTKFCLISPLK